MTTERKPVLWDQDAYKAFLPSELKDPQSTLVCQHPPIFRDYKRSRCRLCAEKVETTE